jgi:hypothetical protein
MDLPRTATGETLRRARSIHLSAQSCKIRACSPGSGRLEVYLSAFAFAVQIQKRNEKRVNSIYVVDGGTNVWYWVGSHSDYDKFVGDT